jgi:DNA-binding transcriptional regulator YiaG
MQGSNTKPKWAEIIKKIRRTLRENQTQFGQRFAVSHAAVSDWERGVTDPPGEVTWWLVQQGACDEQ